MTDIMPCQMCQSKGQACEAFHGWGDCWEEVYCETCHMKGPTVFDGICVDDMFKQDGYEDDGEEARFDLLTNLWNEMQALIARGLLLDKVDEQTKKVRL